MNTKNWTIGKRIVVGFGVIMTLLAIVGTIGFIALLSSTSGFSEYRELALRSNLMGRLQANMLSARMQVVKYFDDNSEKHYQQFQQRWTLLEELLARGNEEFTTGDSAATLRQSQRQMGEYKQAFEQVVEKFKARDKIVLEGMDHHGPEAEKHLTAILEHAASLNKSELTVNVGKAMRSLLLARLYALKFLEDNQAEDIQRSRKELRDAMVLLRPMANAIEAPQAARDLQELLEHLDAYQQDFQNVITTINERNDLIDNTLNRLGPQFAEALEDAKLKIKARQDELGPQVQSANFWAVILISATVLAAVVVGVVLSVVITRSIVRVLGRVIEGLQEGSNQVSETAGAVANASQGLADNSGRQAAAIEETSASLEEIVSLIKQNSDNCKHASGMADQNTASTREARSLAENALNMAKEGDQAVERMGEAINLIQNSSQETAKVVKTIDDIAFQTNLLALNAAVEAARAGEVGKGFAVVAEEVRNLAQRSAQAAKETADLIEESSKNSQRGVTVSNEVMETFKTIEDTIQKVATHVAEISAASEEQNQTINSVAAASEEQTSGIDQINDGVNQIDQTTQSNAASAEELAASAEELSGQTEELNGMILDLQTVVGGSSSSANAGDYRAQTSPAGSRPRARKKTQPSRNDGKLKRPQMDEETEAEETEDESEASIPFEEASEMKADF
jgi:methyl-accepting chemotaxis protein